MCVISCRMAFTSESAQRPMNQCRTTKALFRSLLPEGFRLRKVQARRRWRRARAVTVGVILYLAVVVLGIWGLVALRLA